MFFRPLYEECSTTFTFAILSMIWVTLHFAKNIDAPAPSLPHHYIHARQENLLGWRNQVDRIHGFSKVYDDPYYFFDASTWASRENMAAT